MIDRAGRLVGFEFLPLFKESSLLEALRRLPYIRLTADAKRVRLFLNGSPSEDVSIIDDQSFGGRIYRADEGEWAISLQTDWLSATERGTIRAYQASS
jgi:hypothetical protein